MSINDAMQREFLRASDSGDFITTKAVKETKSFTITGAIDPKTGRKVGTVAVFIHFHIQWSLRLPPLQANENGRE